MDTLLVMGVRFLERSHGGWAGKFLRMFRADRLHLHHLLGHFGGKRSRIVGLLYTLVICFCGLALLVAMKGDLILGVALVAFEFLVILAMRQMGLAMEARRIARQQTDAIKKDFLETTQATPSNVRQFPRPGGRV